MVNRNWEVSNALDRLEPVFRASRLTEEEIENKALLFGIPADRLWAAHHLYALVRRQEDDKSTR